MIRDRFRMTEDRRVMLVAWATGSVVTTILAWGKGVGVLIALALFLGWGIGMVSLAVLAAAHEAIHFILGLAFKDWADRK
jgi:hypothetical protein